jgi:hypothetical protein
LILKWNSCSEQKKKKQRKKSDWNTEGRSQVIPVCRQYDPILKRPQRLHKKLISV